MSEQLPGLDELMATVGDWWLPTEDDKFRLFVHEEGSGPGVLIVHGGPGVDHSYMLEPLQFLTDDHRVIWYDQRGSLRSPIGSDADLEFISFERHVDDLILVAETTESRVLIAHSHGTMIASAAIGLRPELFDRVVLVGPIPPGMWGNPRGRAWMAERNKVAAERMSRLGLDSEDLTPQEQQLRWRISYVTSNAVSVRALSEDRWPGFEFYRQNIGSRGGYSTNATQTPEDLKAALAGLGPRVIVVIGDQDFGDPGPVEWPRLADELGVGLTVIPDAGHDVWLDAPDSFAQAVHSALTHDI